MFRLGETKRAKEAPKLTDWINVGVTVDLLFVGFMQRLVYKKQLAQMRRDGQQTQELVNFAN